MHEFSLAINIVEIVEHEAEKVNTSHVTEFVVEVGAMSGVIKDALTLALDSALEDSRFKNIKYHISELPGMAKCNNCNNEFFIDSLYEPCPECHEFNSNIIQGKELKVKSIKIE